MKHFGTSESGKDIATFESAPFTIDANGNPVFRTIVIDSGHGHYPIIYANEIGELRCNDPVHGDYPLFKQ